MALDRSSLAFMLVVVTSLLWRRRKTRAAQDDDDNKSPEVQRLESLFASGQLVHPFLRAEYFQRGCMDTINEEDVVANLTDLSSALATCCGVSTTGEEECSPLVDELVRDIGPETQHIIVILCDAMGNAILNRHLPESAFLHRHNQSQRLRTVFPSTTPAALTTLATAQWPGQHGMPGWDLLEQQGGCDYPGEGNHDHEQLRILAPHITDFRSNQPAKCMLENVFLVPPWPSRSPCKRHMTYINAYNGNDTCDASDFSLWQTGRQTNKNASSRVVMESIGDIDMSTLGTPEGSRVALECFRDGVDKVLGVIANAEVAANGTSRQSTYTYLYTGHPDVHMHPLGTEHPEVHAVVNGLNDEIERLWELLGDRSSLLSTYAQCEITQGSASSRVDATIVVTADHGHITVNPADMIVLPDEIVECLEYANIGVHGHGRHAYLHCRAGLHATLRERWRALPELQNSFILLTIEEATELKLFGPVAPTLKVRPRLGDFVAISISSRTLTTPKEWAKHKHHCQGAHGSLSEEETMIPFVLCGPSRDE